MSLGLLRDIVSARQELEGPASEEWFDRLERQESELETQLKEAQTVDWLLGLDAAASLSRFWFYRGRIDRGRRWLGELLEAGQDTPSVERARALHAAGGLAFRQADNEVAKAYERAALEMARFLERPEIEGDALVGLARTGLRDHDPAIVLEYGAAARSIAGRIADDALDLQALHCIAEAFRMDGRLAEARACYTESLERNRAKGAATMVAVELNNLSFLDKAAGRLDLAQERLGGAIAISMRTNNSYLLAHHLVALAAVLTAAGRAHEAVRLLGSADDLFERTGLTLDPADEPERDHAIATCSRQLGPTAFDTEYAAGKDLDPGEYASGLDLSGHQLPEGVEHG